MLDIGFDRGHFANNKNVCAQVENFLRYIILNAGNECNYGDHRGNSDHYAQKREHGAKLVRPQGPQRDANGFSDVHGVGYRLSAWASGEATFLSDSSLSAHLSMRCERAIGSGSRKPAAGSPGPSHIMIP